MELNDCAFIKDIVANIINTIPYTEASNPLYSDTNYEKPEDYFRLVRVCNKYDITEVCTKIQNGGSLCGFHCLFNMINYIQFKQANAYEERCQCLRKMNSTSLFWEFSYCQLRYLLNHEEITENTKIELKKEGSIDRSHMEILLHNPLIAGTFKSGADYEIQTQYFSYCYNGIQGMEKEELKQYQESISYFKNWNPNETNKTLLNFILLGTTCHWSVLIMENSKEGISFCYLDSLQHKILNLIQDDLFQNLRYLGSNYEEYKLIKSLAHAYSENYFDDLKKYRKPPSEWHVQAFTHWIVDINAIVNYHLKLIYENLTVYDIAIECEINTMLRTFEKYNHCDLAASMFEDLPEAEIKNNLIHWLQEEYHPVLLREQVLDVISFFDYSGKVKELRVYNKLCIWVNYCQELITAKLKELTSDEETLIKRFSEVMDKFQIFA